MRDRPILFSGPMVRAMLAGDKTQTRREVTPHNIRLWMGEEVGSVKPAAELLAIAFEEAAEFRSLDGAQAWTAKARDYQNADRTNWQARSTYGFAGDFLWVRETLRRTAEGDWTYDIGGDVIANLRASLPDFDFVLEVDPSDGDALRTRAAVHSNLAVALR
ncbi:MAG: hypothetical protein HY859_06700, partial [Caulobacterales bacterium]|nr:hypothetical protein [Caulobacterales bacterium]